MATWPIRNDRSGFEALVSSLADSRLAAITVMHSSLEQAEPAVELVRAHWQGPIGVYPHVGTFVPPHWQFEDITPEEFTAHAEGWVRARSPADRGLLWHQTRAHRCSQAGRARVTRRQDGAANDAGRLQLGSEDLDELDAAIFQHLQEDGRRAYRAIAQDLGVPEATVRFRVNRLVREGIVHLTATIHPQRLGGLLVTLLIRVQIPQREAVIRELSGWPEVMYLSSCTGRADLMLQVVTGGLSELNGLLTERLEQIQGITEVETLLELEVFKAQYAFPPSLQRHRSRRPDA